MSELESLRKPVTPAESMAAEGFAEQGNLERVASDLSASLWQQASIHNRPSPFKTQAKSDQLKPAQDNPTEKASPWGKPSPAPPLPEKSEPLPSWIKPGVPKPGEPEKPGVQKTPDIAKPHEKIPGSAQPDLFPPFQKQPQKPREFSPLPSQLKDHLPKFNTGDSKLDKQAPGRAVDSGPAKLYELRRLNYRSADHSTPDAMVRVPSDFDPAKPINLVIYNHGWQSTAQSAYHDNNLNEQLKAAPRNTILIVPEWQRDAGAANSKQGRFAESGRFNKMLQEIFDKTPELKGKTLNDVKSIDIFSHSAGYVPSETVIYKNDLQNKVRSITLLDSNYDGTGFDRWLKDNISALAKGEKSFYNFFNDTATNSKNQAERVKDMLSKAGYNRSLVYTDYNNAGSVMDADSLLQHSIVFKFSKVTVGKSGPHSAMPMLYVAPVEQAMAKKKL